MQTLCKATVAPLLNFSNSNHLPKLACTNETRISTSFFSYHQRFPKKNMELIFWYTTLRTFNTTKKWIAMLDRTCLKTIWWPPLKSKDIFQPATLFLILVTKGSNSLAVSLPTTMGTPKYVIGKLPFAKPDNLFKLVLLPELINLKKMSAYFSLLINWPNHRSYTPKTLRRFYKDLLSLLMNTKRSSV